LCAGRIQYAELGGSGGHGRGADKMAALEVDLFRVGIGESLVV
jgi:hypothetical protein